MHGVPLGAISTVVIFVLPKICCMNLPDYEASFKLLGNEELAHIVQMPGEHLPDC